MSAIAAGACMTRLRILTSHFSVAGEVPLDMFMIALRYKDKLPVWPNHQRFDKNLRNVRL
jgi:hypothetical protein